MKVTINESSQILTLLNNLLNYPAPVEYAQRFQQSYALYEEIIRKAQEAVFGGDTVRVYLDKKIAEAIEAEKDSEGYNEEALKQRVTAEVLNTEIDVAKTEYFYNPQAPMGPQFMVAGSRLVDFHWEADYREATENAEVPAEILEKVAEVETPAPVEAEAAEA